MNDLSNILHRCNNVKRTRDKYLHALHNVYDDKGTGEESASQPLAVNRSSLIRTNKRLREETYTIGVRRNYRYGVIIKISATRGERDKVRGELCKIVPKQSEKYIMSYDQPNF